MMPASQGAWSPDGSKIAVQDQNPASTGDRDIVIYDAASRAELDNLTDDATPDFNPTWSPDGLKIAWERKVGTGNP